MIWRTTESYYEWTPLNDFMSCLRSLAVQRMKILTAYELPMRSMHTKPKKVGQKSFDRRNTFKNRLRHRHTSSYSRWIFKRTAWMHRDENFMLDFSVSLEMKTWQPRRNGWPQHRTKTPTKDTIGFRVSIYFESQQDRKSEKINKSNFYVTVELETIFSFSFSFRLLFRLNRNREIVSKRLRRRHECTDKERNRKQSTNNVHVWRLSSMCAGRLQSQHTSAFIFGGCPDEDADNRKK